MCNDASKLPRLQLTALVCYYGKHYSSFIWHTKLQEWIYFDDATVIQVNKRTCAPLALSVMLILINNHNYDLCKQNGSQIRPHRYGAWCLTLRSCCVCKHIDSWIWMSLQSPYIWFSHWKWKSIEFCWSIHVVAIIYNRDQHWNLFCTFTAFCHICCCQTVKPAYFWV